MAGDDDVLTGAQVRAARALLRWSAEDLAGFSRLGVATVRRAEAHDGPPPSTAANIRAIRDAFEHAGLEFIFDDGLGVGVKISKSIACSAPITHDN